MTDRPTHPELVWRCDERLDRHTALRTGGVCPHFVVVHGLDALPIALEHLDALPGTPLVLGAGTRTAFRDGPYDRAVLRLGTGFSYLRAEGGQIEVGAATPCPALAWWAAGQGARDLAALARVPGSVGAALACDDGPWRAAFTEVLVAGRGAPRWRPVEKAFGARLILAARARLAEGSADRALAAARSALAGARALPGWYKALSRGSVSAELIRVGAVGVRIRGASIPTEAPEMIVNAGRGPAADLLLLHRAALDRVSRLRGIDLEPSFSFLGRS